jgi:cyclophilin family peptidyl-prolyl cis-trans isomerase
VACGGTVPALASTVKPSSDAPPKLDLRQGKDYRATIDTSCGRIELDLLEDQAPVTVNNFVFLADEGFYDGLTFHRIATDPPVIQGGDPEGTGQGGPGYQLEDEIVKSLTFDHPGVVAMANTGIPDTNGSQFFITTGPARPLDGSYSIFGRVTSGIDVVRTIQALPATPEETPKQTVYIERVRIETR